MGSVLGYLIAGIVIGPYLLEFLEEGRRYHATKPILEWWWMVISNRFRAKSLKTLLGNAKNWFASLALLSVWGHALESCLGKELVWVFLASCPSLLDLSMELSCLNGDCTPNSLRKKNQMESQVGKLSLWSGYWCRDLLSIPIFWAILSTFGRAGSVSNRARSKDQMVFWSKAIPGCFRRSLFFGAHWRVVLLGRIWIRSTVKLGFTKPRLRELIHCLCLIDCGRNRLS